MCHGVLDSSTRDSSHSFQMRVLSEVGKVETETFAFFSHLGIKTSQYCSRCGQSCRSQHSKKLIHSFILSFLQPKCRVSAGELMIKQRSLDELTAKRGDQHIIRKQCEKCHYGDMKGRLLKCTRESHLLGLDKAS